MTKFALVLFPIFLFEIILTAQVPSLYGICLTNPTNSVFQVNALPGHEMPSNLTNAIYTTLDNTSQNNYYNGSLMLCSDGMMYGTGAKNSNEGVIFRFNPLNSSYTELKTMSGINGSRAFGPLLEASNGKLYGIAYDGGVYNYGVVFSFDVHTGIYTKIFDLDTTSGGFASGRLTQASDGKIYGMAFHYLFSFDTIHNAYTPLFYFNASDGYSTNGGTLVQAANGKLYGVTESGGDYLQGVIFSFDPTTNSYTKLFSFRDAPPTFVDGKFPAGQLIQANDGNLYGTTSSGGALYNGTLFRYNIGTNTYTKLYDFSSPDSICSRPQATLMQASDGKLYGTGVQSFLFPKGGIFSYDLTSNKYTEALIGPYDYLPLQNTTLVEFDSGSFCRASLLILPDVYTGVYYGIPLTIGNNLSYFWDFGDGSTSVMPYPSYSYNQPGNYNVCLTVNNGAGCIYTFCDSSFLVFKTESGLMSQLIIRDPATLGITAPESETEPAIFPNPANESVSIKMENRGLYELLLFNSMAQIIEKKQINENGKFSTEGLAVGLYFIKIIDLQRGKEITTRKISVFH